MLCVEASIWHPSVRYWTTNFLLIICRCGCTLNLCKILNTQISFLGMERITEDMREKLEKMRKMKINAAVLSTSYFEGNKTNILLVLQSCSPQMHVGQRIFGWKKGRATLLQLHGPLEQIEYVEQCCILGFIMMRRLRYLSACYTIEYPYYSHQSSILRYCSIFPGVLWLNANH